MSVFVAAFLVSLLFLAMAVYAYTPLKRGDTVRPTPPQDTAIPTYGPLAPLPIPVTLDPEDDDNGQ